jgi:hypothetical protein
MARGKESSSSLPASTVAKRIPKTVNSTKSLALLTSATKEKEKLAAASGGKSKKKPTNERPATKQPASKKQKVEEKSEETFNITSGMLGQFMIWILSIFKFKMPISDLAQNLEQFGIPAITNQMTDDIEELAKKIDYRATPNFNYWQIFTFAQSLYYAHHKVWPGTEVNGILSSMISYKFRNKFNNWKQKDVTHQSFADFQEEYHLIFPETVSLATGPQSVAEACSRIEWFSVKKTHEEEWKWIEDIISKLPAYLPGVSPDAYPDSDSVPRPYISSMEESVDYFRLVARLQEEQGDEEGDQPAEDGPADDDHNQEE